MANFERLWSVSITRGMRAQGPNWYRRMIQDEIKKELKATVGPEIERAYKGTVKGWKRKPTFRAFTRFGPRGDVRLGLSMGGSALIKGRYRMIDQGGKFGRKQVRLVPKIRERQKPVYGWSSSQQRRTVVGTETTTY